MVDQRNRQENAPKSVVTALGGEERLRKHSALGTSLVMPKNWASDKRNAYSAFVAWPTWLASVYDGRGIQP